MNEKWIVITTINKPTRTIELVSQLCSTGEWNAVVVGDTRTPADWSYERISFLSVADQKSLFGAYADSIPYRHYCRKNLGYLFAMENGAQLILETDDDNNPYESFGKNVHQLATGRRLTGSGWINVYPHFLNGTTKHPIWPRGLPLDAIDSIGTAVEQSAPVDAPIQQYLADNDPDVDAVYRLTTKTPVFFERAAQPLIMDADSWVPFNSQNTAFFREAFPLLYLPCHVSFRMTDIWRSFVAQAALKRHSRFLVFHPPTVEQLRNEHDLMRDFADEVVGYLNNRKIGELLAETILKIEASSNIAATAATLWRALVDADYVPRNELPLIDEWFQRISALA